MIRTVYWSDSCSLRSMVSLDSVGKRTGLGRIDAFWNLETLFKSVAVLVGVIALAGVAGAQGQTQDPSPQERSAAAEDRAVPPDTSTTSTATVSGIRLPFSYVPEISGKTAVGKRFWTPSTDFGTRRFLGNVSGHIGFPPVNPNAPWKASGGLSYSLDNGTVARISVVGYRNYKMPLFMSQPIGSDQDLTLPLVSFTDLSQREVHWEISAGVEKTFIRTAGGVTIGAVADLFLPLNNVSSPLTNVSPPRVAPDTPILRSMTIRGGVKVGF